MKSRCWETGEWCWHLKSSKSSWKVWSWRIQNVEVCSLNSPFAEIFFHKCLLGCIKCVFCIYWYDHVVLAFILFTWCITLIVLQMLNQPWIPGINKSQLIFLMYCSIWFGNILLRIIASMFIMDDGMQFCFFVMSLHGFGIQRHHKKWIMVASYNELGSLPSFQIFWSSLRRIGVNSLNVW